MNLLKEGKTNWKYILIIVILAIVVSAGILWFSAQLEFLSLEFPEIKKPEKIKEKTVDWKVYRNEEFGIELEYPKDWETLTFQSQKDDVYVFNSQNETIKPIWYHKPSGIIAFIMRGKKYELVYGGEGYQDILKVIFPNKKIKTIYTISEQDVRRYGEAIGIGNVNISPNGRYISFGVSVYEAYQPFMINIETNQNIFEGLDILCHPENDIYWSPNNEVLAVQSYIDEINGEGIGGLFVSEYGNPDKLSEVFSFTPIESISGAHIYNIYFSSDEKLFFTAILKECKPEGRCRPAGTIKYEYNVKTRELKEIK